MPLWRTFYHIVFATQERRPLLTPPLRAASTRLLQRKAEDLGCVVHAVGVQPEHVHLVVSIPPSRAVAFVVAQPKGTSSHAIGAHRLPGELFAWQRGYGLFTFGERSLPVIVRYVREQDQHHANGKLWALFERSGDDDANASQDHGASP